jgi:hypothetical protein
VWKTAQRPNSLRYFSAILFLTAAAIHGWLTPAHFGEWWGYGVVFLATAVAQVLGGLIVVWWPRPELLLVGIVGNLALIVLYVVTRTSGIPPVGPSAGEVEKMDALGLASVSAEALLVVMLVTLRCMSPATRVSSLRSGA